MQLTEMMSTSANAFKKAKISVNLFVVKIKFSHDLDFDQ